MIQLLARRDAIYHGKKVDRLRFRPEASHDSQPQRRSLFAPHAAILLASLSFYRGDKPNAQYYYKERHDYRRMAIQKDHWPAGRAGANIIVVPPAIRNRHDFHSRRAASPAGLV